MAKNDNTLEQKRLAYEAQMNAAKAKLQGIKPEPEPERKPVYTPSEPFSFTFNQQIMHFQPGDFIDDAAMIKAMQDGGCQIVEAQDAHWHQCTKCGHRFPEKKG